jgi:hypothetical protein
VLARVEAQQNRKPAKRAIMTKKANKPDVRKSSVMHGSPHVVAQIFEKCHLGSCVIGSATVLSAAAGYRLHGLLLAEGRFAGASSVASPA